MLHRTILLVHTQTALAHNTHNNAKSALSGPATSPFLNMPNIMQTCQIYTTAPRSSTIPVRNYRGAHKIFLVVVRAYL